MLELFFIFLFGLIIGSFLNVVIGRYNTGLTLKGRSRCFVCGKTLGWRELIPVISFVIQKGRCSSCLSKISWQYPLVELLTGLVFVLVYWRLDQMFSSFSLTFVLTLILYLVISSILIVITVYDIRHKIIPDNFAYWFAGLSFLIPFAMSLSLGTAEILSLFSRLIAGIIFALIFGLLWYWSRGLWLGFGDIKLVFGIGAFSVLFPGIMALFIAFWSGAIFGLSLILVSRFWPRKELVSLKTELPFAPFLVFGTLIAFIFDLSIDRLF